ncbi:MAG TPA: YitT family protein [Saprospiraceae bacterium]|nr:YitT family protein [Saprospiraceae bacterium]HMV24495.1 YitT family protein [Saprospiraceae bacterium]HMW75193.1 YitT family protein [Saprospiraceae bacterium]HMX83529.1 YitT family protein [Saprospiraceae bacterium]HMX85908.1 YitT family protein [Saprospiraceae bacterium]
MHELWTKILSYTTLRDREKRRKYKYGYSVYVLAKAQREFRILLKRYVKDSILITAGIFSAAFGLKGFLLTNHFIDGGATGISLLLSIVLKMPLPLFIILVNIPFIYLAYKTVGKIFAIKTSLAITGLSIVLATVTFPNVTDDNLLVAIFGGFFLGAGIGLAVRGGSVIDGTEVLAIYLSRKLSTTLGDIIILINIIIFSAAAYFLSIEAAMYSMITYLSASKTLDFIAEGIEEYIGVTIISKQFEKIRQMIAERMGRGLTVYNGKRGYGKSGDTLEIDIIFTVVTRLELSKLNVELEKIDPDAFVIMSAIKDTKGGMIKQRPLKH